MKELLPKQVLPPTQEDWGENPQSYWDNDYFPRLSNMVQYAEEQRQAENFNTVGQLVQAWLFDKSGDQQYVRLKDELIEQLVIENDQYDDKDNPLAWFAVAMVGLTRIMVVTANTTGTNISKAREKADSLYATFDVYDGKILSRTIDDTEISWAGEIGQDKVASLVKQGKSEEARELALTLKASLEEKIEREETAFADESALCVVNWRLAAIENDLEVMAQVLEHSHHLHSQNKNYQRMGELAKMSKNYLLRNFFKCILKPKQSNRVLAFANKQLLKLNLSQY